MTTPAKPRRRPLRTFLLVSMAAVLICCGGVVAVVTWLSARASTDTFGKIEFANPLNIPPLAQSQVDDKGRRVFELQAGAGTHDFGSGRTARTWGFNGTYLGPTLRASRGEQVIVKVRNTLGEDTSVHWHGMHLPAAMDGGPHQLVRTRGDWAPTWKIDQPAATLWYHPHRHTHTADHVYRGLAGMFIVDDPESGALPLPKRYGIDDIPLVVQDKKFARGELDDSAAAFSDLGVLGRDVVVNGTYAPYLDVKTSLVRLRILNASNARAYHFGFSDDRSFDLVGTDGGLLDRPYKMDRIQLSSGERAEIVVSMRAGEKVVLRSYPADLGSGFLQFNGAGDRFDVLELRAAGTLETSPAVPLQLVPIERLDPATATVTREFRLSGHNINGDQMDMSRIDHVSTVDTTEIWEVRGQEDTPHSFHIHDVQFQILNPDEPYLSGWKDTVALKGNRTYRLIMRFTDYTDPNRAYMYHCHVLFHEDQGMMGQFVVVKPGESPGRAL